MGMNARCTLRILDKEHKDRSLDTIGRIRAASEEARWAIDEFGNPTGNEGSWRTSDDDLRSFTLNSPGLQLQLDKTGGEPFWDRYYFYGGGMQYCKSEVVHEEFDEKKLAPAPRAVMVPDAPVTVVGQWKSENIINADGSTTKGEPQLHWEMARGDVKLERSDAELRDWRRKGQSITDVVRQFHVEAYFEAVVGD